MNIETSGGSFREGPGESGKGLTFEEYSDKKESRIEEEKNALVNGVMRAMEQVGAKGGDHELGLRQLLMLERELTDLMNQYVNKGVMTSLEPAKQKAFLESITDRIPPAARATWEGVVKKWKEENFIPLTESGLN